MVSYHWHFNNQALYHRHQQQHNHACTVSVHLMLWCKLLMLLRTAVGQIPCWQMARLCAMSDMRSCVWLTSCLFISFFLFFSFSLAQLHLTHWCDFLGVCHAGVWHDRVPASEERGAQWLPYKAGVQDCLHHHRGLHWHDNPILRSVHICFVFIPLSVPKMVWCTVLVSVLRAIPLYCNWGRFWTSLFWPCKSVLLGISQ